MIQKILTHLGFIKKSLREKKGFTMIELMIAVTIIALLSGISITIYRNYIQRARVTAAKTQIRQMKAILDAEYMGNYPSEEEGLRRLVDDGKMKARGLKDPWGKPYVYQLRDGEFIIKSYGSDRREGGTGYAKDLLSSDL